MNLTTGLIGLPLVGKTTLFNLLTNSQLETSNFLTGKTETNVGVARVPDKRIDFLSDMFNPRKTNYAQIQISDMPGLVRGASQGQGVGNKFLSDIRNVDMLVHVVRAFDNSEVAHAEDNVDPMRDIETISTELLFADMELLDKRIERIQSGKKIKKEQQQEMELLKKLLDALENEIPLTAVEISEDEKEMLQHYNFFTEIPIMLVINIDEEQFKNNDYPGKADIEAWAKERNIPVLTICAKIEMEISQLPSEDREMFMEDLGISISGVDRLAKASYDFLGLIPFFTCGEDEVKAWTIRRGSNAKKAAGKIHSDIERGFIRAEVVKYEDLVEYGSMSKLKDEGKYHLEGKEYIVEDGDIINFRFNV